MPCEYSRHLAILAVTSNADPDGIHLGILQHSNFVRRYELGNRIRLATIERSLLARGIGIAVDDPDCGIKQKHVWVRKATLARGLFTRTGHETSQSCELTNSRKNPLKEDLRLSFPVRAAYERIHESPVDIVRGSRIGARYESD